MKIFNEWVVISGFSNYEISEDCVVRNVKTKRVIKKHTNLKGYNYFSLRRDGKNHTVMAHRALFCSFVRKLKNNEQINHIDFNRINNSLSNIEAVSVIDNIKHSVAAGRVQDICPVVATKDNKIRYFSSQKLCIRKLKLNKGHFWRALNSSNRTVDGWKISRATK